MDDNDKKLKFIEAMTKHGLTHFSGGGLAGLLGAGDDFQAANAPTADQLNAAQAGVQSGLNQQQNFVTQASAQNGFGNQSNVFAQQQALANQLQAQSNGQGPNIAQNQLNQTTGQNIANQAAMAAGQRGAGTNVGLIARQVGQQGAATQQQATGQAATLEAQQQIAAQQALQSQQAQLQNVAGNQISTQMGGINNYATGQQQNQATLQGANNAANAINAGVAAQNSQSGSNIIGGLLGGAGAVAGKVFKFDGGEITDPHMDALSRIFHGKTLNEKAGGSIPGKATVSGDSVKNDTVPAMLSPGEVVIDRDTMADKGQLGQMARALAAHIQKKNGGKK